MEQEVGYTEMKLQVRFGRQRLKSREWVTSTRVSVE